MEHSKHILVVANRSVATPALLEEIERRSTAEACAFSLLIPDAADDSVAEWTLEHAIPLVSRAAGAPVSGMLVHARDPYDAIAEALRAEAFDEVVISTLPRSRSRWLRRSLPRRVARLGVPVSVVTPEGEPLLHV